MEGTNTRFSLYKDSNENYGITNTFFKSYEILHNEEFKVIAKIFRRYPEK